MSSGYRPFGRDDLPVTGEYEEYEAAEERPERYVGGEEPTLWTPEIRPPRHSIFSPLLIERASSVFVSGEERQRGAKRPRDTDEGNSRPTKKRRTQLPPGQCYISNRNFKDPAEYKFRKDAIKCSYLTDRLLEVILAVSPELAELEIIKALKKALTKLKLLTTLHTSRYKDEQYYVTERAEYYRSLGEDEAMLVYMDPQEIAAVLGVECPEEFGAESELGVGVKKTYTPHTSTTLSYRKQGKTNTKIIEHATQVTILAYKFITAIPGVIMETENIAAIQPILDLAHGLDTYISSKNSNNGTFYSSWDKVNKKFSYVDIAAEIEAVLGSSPEPTHHVSSAPTQAISPAITVYPVTKTPPCTERFRRAERGGGAHWRMIAASHATENLVP